jgi:dTDP-glucose 4,6-dehydratase
MKRVLLTGAGGFIGHHALAHLLKNTDWEFVVTDSFKNKGTTARLRSVFDENESYANRVSVIVHDLRVPIDKVTFREIGNIDTIINYASESHVDRSITDPRNFIENNVQSILTMLDFAKAQDNLSEFIQISTDEVFGPALNNVMHTENDPHKPSNPYAASKAAQENICHSYWRTYGVPMIITNTMNIFGERQDNEKFIPKSISAIVNHKKMPVHAKFENGQWSSGSRFYLHARNQANAIKFIIENSKKINLKFNSADNQLEKINIVGELEMYNDELVKYISKVIGIDADIEYVDFHSSRPGHDIRYALDGSKLKSMGWSPPIDMYNSLEKTVNWYLRNPKWLEEA